jgi:Protein of unknown function (DUF2846)
VKRLTTLLLIIVGFPFAVPAQQPQTATVYFYRLQETFGAMMNPAVYCDGAEIATIRNGRFFVATFPAGKHAITSTFRESGVALDLQPGQTYYLRFEMEKQGFAGHKRAEVTEVQQGQGTYEVAQLKPAEPKDVKDPTVVFGPLATSTPHPH